MFLFWKSNFFALYLCKLKIMVGKIITLLTVILSFIMFIYSWAIEDTNNLIFWSVLLLFNYISLGVTQIFERIDEK